MKGSGGPTLVKTGAGFKFVKGWGVQATLVKKGADSNSVREGLALSGGQAASTREGLGGPTFIRKGAGSNS